MKICKKIFGEINLTWKKLIIFAIIIGIYTGIMAMLPIAKDTSFADISIYMEVWILFGIIIIVNSKSPIDSALKCFIFFLISQPIVYLIQVPFSTLKWELFKFYKIWFIYTILTFPMGYIGYYIKKDKWWGLLILLPMILIISYSYIGYLSEVITFFPNHLLSLLFCIITMLIYPIVLFKNKINKYIGIIISMIILIISTIMVFQNGKISYNTDILASGETVIFDDSYKVYLKDESFGKVSIRYEEEIEDYLVHAEFIKIGDTELILELPNGKKEVFDLEIKRDTYNIRKLKEENMKKEIEKNIKIKIKDQILEIELENNSSVNALIQKLEEKNLELNCIDYGGFEKIGELEFNLPRNDKEIKTECGDIVLYQGNQISIFYNSNSWSYTKLGKIKNKTDDEIKEILGNGNIDIVFYIEKD